MTSEADAANAPVQQFGTYSGVFRPTMLTILGALIYLREGWMVGNVGLLGALLVIGVATAITGLTALSVASIASNVRVPRGGVFAIISQALGIEAGGAIGMPLYVAQTVSATMYVYAFSEAWGFLFPSHPPWLVATLGFAALAFLAWRSAGLAFRAQGVMVVVVVVALGSAALGLFTVPTLHSPTWVGMHAEADLGAVFGIFFPAVTGIMVGVGMSGELSEPRRSIPRGTLWAWGVTTAVYVLFAFWYALVASRDELMHQRLVMVENAAVGPLVLCGLVASTLMASLSSLVAAPRLLQAMAEHNALPGSAWLRELSQDGQPHNAVLATTALAGLGLFAGSLDALAPLITSFFMATFLAVNLVVLVQMQLGMISFRPTFRIPKAVPVVGALLCVVGMWAGSPFGGMLELGLGAGIYLLLLRRKLETPWETVRSGVAVSLAGWAARQVADVRLGERSWKPDLLVPLRSHAQARDVRPLVDALIGRAGSVRWVAMGPSEREREQLASLVQEQRALDLYASWAALRATPYEVGLGLALDTLRGDLFPPNLVLLDGRDLDEQMLRVTLQDCQELALGVALWNAPDQGGISAVAQPEMMPRSITVWISSRAPEWRLELHVANLDLPVLVGFLLAEAWGAELRLAMVVSSSAEVREANAFLQALIGQARLPSGTHAWVHTGSFDAALAAAPACDLHLFGMSAELSLCRVRALAERTGTANLWLRDSGHESALA